MKKHYYWMSLLLLGSLLLLNACGGEDEDPAPAPSNQITSANGVTISLTWLTGGTPQLALQDADLDLIIFDSNENFVTGGFNSSLFESIVFGLTQPNGNFTAEVELYERVANKAINYTLTVAGGGNEIAFTGTFATSAPEGELRAVARITKSGNTYTVVAP